MRDAWPVLLGLLAIPVLMWLVDAIPGRSFYSRRAFEPPVRTYEELSRQVAANNGYARVEPYHTHSDWLVDADCPACADRPPLRGEVHRLGPYGRGLPDWDGRELPPYGPPAAASREIEPW